MANCKDCIHVEICEDFTRHKLSPSKAEEILPILRECGNTCEHFKDRSRFVELPCVGDKVYELCRINQFGDYKIVESEIRGFIVDTNGTAFDYELLGERFFLTHEEAEQALKEREANANDLPQSNNHS